MAGLPRVVLAVLSLAGLATGIIPGLLSPLGGGVGQRFGGPVGPGGNPFLGGLFGRGAPGGGLGGGLGGLVSKLPTFKAEAGPGGIGGEGLLPGLLKATVGVQRLVGSPGPVGSPSLNGLFGVGFPGMPIAGGGPGVGLSGPSSAGVPGGGAPSANGGMRSAPTDGREGAAPTGAGSTGSTKDGESSEEKEDKKPKSPPSGGSRRRENEPSRRRAGGSSGSRKEENSSEERESSGGSKTTTKPPRRPDAEGPGSDGSRGDDDSSKETTTKKKSDASGEDYDSSEDKRPKKTRKSRRRGRGGRRARGSGREKRSLMDEFDLMGAKGAHHAFDNVPDHVKVVYCGRHEVPNPGGIEDHFCHPDATWDTLLRMRPDCVCQQGFLRNSWGECISPAECDHCSDKHHLNMDYHLCESPCPIVCNQPIDENCPNTCFKECACRPGYIRDYPNGPCVSIKQCLPGCRGRNQIFSLCSSLCPPTCRKPVPKRCPNICAGEGCICKPGYVVKKFEPLVCVRPENCPGRRKKCPGPNQRYSRCIRRCAPSCFRRRHRYCGRDCLGRGCVCKRGYVVLQRRPLVCVRRDECPARRKKCPARNQVYMYCKSKCPRRCGEPKPRKCVAACGGEGCACKPGYVIKQEDPLVCVRRYQCDLEDIGHKGVKGAMGTKGSMGAKEAMGAKGSMESMVSMGAKGAKGAMGVKGAKSSSPYPPLPSWPSQTNEF